jgi:outer membrane protein OmpA-like peptidoglycan-associated protein
MRTCILILMFGLISKLCFTQVDANNSEKRNVYNVKGNYYFDRNEFKKAIIYYNLAYQKDTSDYFSILKRAEAYAQLKLNAQAEECYRIVFESSFQVNNVYRLKYALVLLANNKPEEFKHWLGLYNQVVDKDIKGENNLISSEKRAQIYKDTSVVLLSNNQAPDTIRFKIKYAGYQYRKKAPTEDNQIYIVLDNGDEYAINATTTNDFKFSFQPMEDYKLIIQHENITADNILKNEKLTPEQRKRIFLSPPPTQKDELNLQKGMKYQFSSGRYTITPQYINTLKELAGTFKSNDADAVDLTALVKEQQLVNGEIYTIKFAKTINPKDSHKKLEISSVTMNDKTINIYGQSFLLVLPERTAENLAIQTDIDEIKKNFNTKQFALHVDDSPMFKAEERPEQKWLLALTVNTKSIKEIKPANQLSAKDISIIPGTEYILTLNKPDPNTGRDVEVIVPLTKGVKYNLSSSQEDKSEFNDNLTKLIVGKKKFESANEEVIDISVLSKELEVQPGEDLSFNLLPVKQIVKKPPLPEEAKSKITLDGKEIEITRDQKYSINVPFNIDHKVNFQTDLSYIQKNFAAVSYTVSMDTVSFTSEIKVDTAGYGYMVIKDEQIKDPVFDMITVNFDLNEHILRPEAEKIIQENVINKLKADNRLYVTIKGYTDALGNADYNLNLSKERAESVKEFLTTNGIGDSRIRTFSYGASQSLKEGINFKTMDESELRKYRKVEIVMYLPK